MIIGIDMGGTNIDGVALRNGTLVKSVKHPVDSSDFFQSVWRCLDALLDDLEYSDIERIHLSTTVCTNAIVEDKVAAVGLILQTGPGLKWQFDRVGSSLEYVSGSIDHRGKVVQDADAARLREIKERFSRESVETLAVVGKFSTRNSAFERQVKEYFADNYNNITMGHSLSGKLNFPRRVQTAYLNAAVGPTFQRFIEAISSALAQKNITAPVYLLKADGGTIDLSGARAKPVETILSGPAASFMGMKALLADNQTDSCFLDVGGTTTDIFFLVDGVPVFEPSGIEIDGRKTLVRAIFSTSIGLGGDSHVRISDGMLRIGPERLGHAVAFGGEHLTVTDALVYLGAMRGTHTDASRSVLERTARQYSASPEVFARDIVDHMCEKIRQKIEEVLAKLNASPVYTIKELLQDRTIKPQTVAVIGGPARALAPYLEKKIGLPVIYPKHYEMANAIGAALAKPTVEITLHADTERGVLTIPELEINEQIGKSYDLRQAAERALAEVISAGKAMGLSSEQAEAEITEASSFNMVRGYLGADKNIRVKAQIRPGLFTEGGVM
ncbi:MAG: hydantoinase/oxoprolinase family protein [Lachnospiraceae bacterium]|jgi:N-methylhydantoinase A/oxoprolinase/acetone carboxylase beta subunit